MADAWLSTCWTEGAWIEGSWEASDTVYLDTVEFQLLSLTIERNLRDVSPKRYIREIRKV